MKSPTPVRAVVCMLVTLALTSPVVVLAQEGAGAQGTGPGGAPPTPASTPEPTPETPRAGEVPPSQEPAPVPGKPEPGPDMAEPPLVGLPFQIRAGVYLLYHQPIDRETIVAGGSLEGASRLEIMSLKLDKQWGDFAGHTEIRLRDGGHTSPGAPNTYLRSFFSSNVWFQEIYAAYKARPSMTFKAGKVYRQFGIFWDESYFGTIIFFDGMQLNPDYGLSLEESRLDVGPVRLMYALQFFAQSDGINGGFDYGRTIGDRPVGDASNLSIYSPNPEGQLDSSGARIGALRNIANGRVVGSLGVSGPYRVELGVSAMTARVRRESLADAYSHGGGVLQYEADLSLTTGDVAPQLNAFFEYAHQQGSAVRKADYFLAGARATFGNVSVRFNTNYVVYHAEPDVTELMLQPGLSYSFGNGVGLHVEYDEWHRKDPRVSTDTIIYDRSFAFVLSYQY